jgi:hypothetical protein
MMKAYLTYTYQSIDRATADDYAKDDVKSQVIVMWKRIKQAGTR